ncbi:UNVERIFIED_ORG: S8 family serine peptidase [Shinella sp. XGS7]|nr:S8 family serine peptidase [Shinella sp. XGS7]
MPSIDAAAGYTPPKGGQALAATSSGTASWHLIEPALAADARVNPWDVCHEMVKQRMGVAGHGQVAFAEPDLNQHWAIGTDEEALQGLQQACTADEQDSKYPVGATHDWYRDAQHTDLAGLPATANGSGVRIAHLDTGYDPEHKSKPVNLEKELARNFVDDDRPNDASDDTSGLWNNKGHGTGTLSILAGAPVPGVGIAGVAPRASVVPIRVANRVVLFKNSAIAQALNYVHELCQTPSTAVDVVTMSMGGLASQAWAEAINALYEAGVVVVTAAGNNFANLPTRNIVYPARFNRVIAACGAMADQSPYADLGLGRMAGNYGPSKKMKTAMSAYTPNIPWARLGCEGMLRFDGSGTSSATPQIAGAAALYIQAHRQMLSELPEGWMRVEAVRKAMFDSSAHLDEVKLGQGVLRAKAALAQPVQASALLTKQDKDTAAFEFFKVLTGLGLSAEQPATLRMLELEALQLSQTPEIESLIPRELDISDLGTGPQMLLVLQAMADHPNASEALKEALRPLRPSTNRHAPSDSAYGKTPSSVVALPSRKVPKPTARRLKVFTYDPSLGQSIDTFKLNETVLAVRWEEGLQPGPVGEYLEVVDIDPASGRCYAPVDLNHPHLLASDGLRPTEANPQFHQQMVYAVAMRTIEHFERALGRRALWAPYLERTTTSNGTTVTNSRYVQRLRIYPHALRARNAYYSPDKKALLLGYFTGSSTGNEGDLQTVFTALSSDIVAHETTHALLDGLHRRFREPTNHDVLAFHEAFADIVALFQHFSLDGALREALSDQLAKASGRFDQANLLSGIARQFGKETGSHGALRDAVGKPAVPVNFKEVTEPHERGEVLVAAVFDAFLQIYKRRSVQPIRLATGGSEVLPQGMLPADLVDALAEVASSVARQVLLMCIRALDYCPPVDITFADFLRAVITADKDLVPHDPHGYRVAFAASFRARGIYPEKVRTVSVDTLCWEPPPEGLIHFGQIVKKLNFSWDMEADRFKAWTNSRENARQLQRWLCDPANVPDSVFTDLGLLGRTPNPEYEVTMLGGSKVAMDLRGLEVHSIRPLKRVGPDGTLLSQVVIELTQALRSKQDTNLVIRGGCTLIVNQETADVAYMVRKRADQLARLERQHSLWADYSPSLRDAYTGAGGWGDEPFAFLHGVH